MGIIGIISSWDGQRKERPIPTTHSVSQSHGLQFFQPTNRQAGGRCDGGGIETERFHAGGSLEQPLGQALGTAFLELAAQQCAFAADRVPEGIVAFELAGTETAFLGDGQRLAQQFGEAHLLAEIRP